MVKRVLHAVAERVVPRLVPVIRFVDGLRRPSRAANTRRLTRRGETAASFTIREATAADIPALAQLHVDTFNETHTLFGRGGPTYATREWQYTKKFAETDGRWFCFVAEGPNGALVGFAIGEPGDFETYGGRLNKLYLLREYQRLGIGTKLVGHVVRRFLSQGIDSMMLFSEASNPTVWFYDAIEGTRILTDKGEFHGAYGWHDLRRLAARCPVE